MMALICGTNALIAATAARADDPPARAAGEKTVPEVDGDRAFGYLTKICDIGPRISGSQGMERQQQLIADHFSKLKAQVRFQSFDAAHPQTRNPVRMNNVIVSWDRAAKERVLVACHYDTRPRADRDVNPQLAVRGVFLGANDGASGVALLMEMGNHLHKIRPTYGVDFVFFDGEELIYNDALDPYFLGSIHFAKDYRDNPPEYKYVAGVVVDMIGDKDLQLYLEQRSMQFAPELTKSIWKTAKRLGVREFIDRPKHDVRDDHLALNEIAGIPACDIIDFNYDHWHTTRDVPAACSGASLAKVARVLLAWLEEVPGPAKKPEKKRTR
ncbi:MAG: M28 family peptidase [Planctomycetia bacterium]|nr:M28 family peptidase [Planctomycetia bacterium]